MAAEGSRKAVVAAFVVNLVIAALKFTAAALTRSAAMLAEGFHSVADTGNQVLLLRGLQAARRPADVRHPFGRGKEVYFWSFLVAVMLFVGGSVLSFTRGLEALEHEHEIRSFSSSFIVLALAFGAETVAFRVARREFNARRGTKGLWRSIRDTTDTPTLVVLFEDTAAMLGLVIAGVGLGLVAGTGNAAWDGIASIAISVLLAIVAVVLAVETKNLLIGEAASRSERAEVRMAVLSLPEVSGVGRLLTMHLGPGAVLVNVEVDLHSGPSPTDAEKAVPAIEAAIRSALPEAKEISVEVVAHHRG